MNKTVPKRLYIEGHQHNAGYVVSLELVDVPPVRIFRTHNIKHVRNVVDRFNRIQARKEAA